MTNTAPHEYNVRLATTDTDVSEVKLIDNMAFAGHRGVSEEELQKVKEHGVLLLLCRSATGDAVGEAQLLYESIPEIPHEFAFPVAYCYGVAIRPGFHAHGLGRILMQSVWDVAIGHGVEEIHLSVRVENYPSLKLMFGQGYEIVNYCKDFYGPDKVEGPRLMMSKTRIKQKKEGSVEQFFVPVPFFGSFNEAAHQAIAQHTKEGRRGIGVNREGLIFA